MLDDWREPVTIHFQPGRDGEYPSAVSRGGMGHRTPMHDNWSVTQYHADSLADLKKLLTRFPTGTTFSFPTGMLSDEMAEQKVFDAIQESLETSGQILVRLPILQ